MKRSHQYSQRETARSERRRSHAHAAANTSTRRRTPTPVTAAGGALGAVGNHRVDRVHVSFGRQTWEAESMLSAVLFDDRGLRLPEWQAAGRTRIVKSGPHRTVYRLDLPCGGFYLKHYKGSDWRTVLRNLALPCRAVLESRAATAVDNLGIETIDTAAVGYRVVGPVVTDSYLISREIAETETLHDLVLNRMSRGARQADLRWRRQVTLQLGRLAAQLHGNGLLHRDFHAGNILVRRGANDGVHLWLIDLHAVTRSRHVTWRRVQGNLALLNNFFTAYSSRSDRLRFFHAYWDGMRELGRTAAGGLLRSRSFEQAARQIETHCRRAVEQAYRRGDRKWIKGNRRLIIDDAGGRRCRGMAELGRPLLSAIRQDPESLFADPAVRYWLRNKDRHRRAAVLVQRGGQPRPCIAEAWTLPATGLLRRLFRPESRARRMWEIAHALRRRNIAAPYPLLFVEDEPRAGRQREYLVVEQIAGAVPLSDFLDDCRGGSGPAERSAPPAELARLLAGQLRRFHDRGFAHEQLTAENLLVSHRSEECAVWLAGLARIRQRRHVSFSRRVYELARLNASLSPETLQLAERLRFLKRYLGSSRWADWKTVWRQVERQVKRIAQSEAMLPTVGNSWRTAVYGNPRN